MSKIIPRPSIAPSPQAAASPASPEDVVSPNSQPVIVTSKEWVLPPRPKPGRKPSADTPASKRKAQNRAAQRAFRERRATRVQELEGKLLELEKEKEIKEMALVNTISKLKMENSYLLKSVEQLKADMQSMSGWQQSQQSQQRQIQQRQQSQQQSLTPSSVGASCNDGSKTSSSNGLGSTSFVNKLTNNVMVNSPSAKSPLSAASPAGSSASSNYLIQQISPAPSGDSPPVFHQNYSQGASIEMKKDDDCGVCVKESCFCEEVGLKEKAPTPKTSSGKSLQDLIDAVQPLAAVSLDRSKRKADSVQETDFTSKFSAKKRMPDLSSLKKKKTVLTQSQRNNNEFMDMKNSNNNTFDESSPVENCGFCSDDTPCVCREAAKEAAKLSSSLQNEVIKEEPELDSEDTSLPPILNQNMRKASLPVMHPGPSVEIRDISNLSPGAVPTVIGPNNKRNSSLSQLATVSTIAESEEKEKAGCTGNPGTCSQCQSDPMSTLFCTTVASKNSVDTQKKSNESSHNSPAPNTPGGQHSAAQTPQAASQSSNRSRQESISSNGMFIPCADAYKTLSRHKQFNSVDFGTLVGKLTTRGMLVEVQSVANVLRELDRNLHN